MTVSICEWELEVTFKTKEQCKNIINDIMELDLHRIPELTYFQEDNRHKLNIGPFSWSTNLGTIADIIKRHDYKDD